MSLPFQEYLPEHVQEMFSTFIPWLIDPKEFKLVISNGSPVALGGGSYGVTLLGVWKEDLMTEKFIAIKYFKACEWKIVL